MFGADPHLAIHVEWLPILMDINVKLGHTFFLSLKLVFLYIRETLVTLQVPPQTPNLFSDNANCTPH